MPLLTQPFRKPYPNPRSSYVDRLQLEEDESGWAEWVQIFIKADVEMQIE